MSVILMAKEREGYLSRMMLTVLKPRILANWITFCPTPELAPFCTIQSPFFKFAKSSIIRSAVKGFTEIVAALTGWIFASFGNGSNASGVVSACVLHVPVHQHRSQGICTESSALHYCPASFLYSLRSDLTSYIKNLYNTLIPTNSPIPLLALDRLEPGLRWVDSLDLIQVCGIDWRGKELDENGIRFWRIWQGIRVQG